MIAQPLLSAELLHRLERLQLATRTRTTGLNHGERRSRQHGASIQFADYREYSLGDDPRMVDWNVYGRSGHLFVKLFEDEALLDVHLLVDVSRSMDWGEPSKLLLARRVAAAIGYVGLVRFDRLYAAPLDAQGGRTLGPLWGRDCASQLLDGIAGWRSGGVTDFERALSGYMRSAGRRPGMVVVISDFLSPTWEEGLRHLLQRHHQVALIHVLCPDEVRPPGGEELRLLDRETGRVIEIHLDSLALDAYARRFADWTGAIERFATDHGAAYVFAESTTAIETLMFDTLRRRKVLA